MEQLIQQMKVILGTNFGLYFKAHTFHWNVKGPTFIALHELFDRVSTEVDGFADTIAERAVQLDALAEGGVLH